MPPIKPNIGSKTDFATRPSVPSSQKESATEFNLIVSAIRANYERLILNWNTDILVNTTLPVGQYVLFNDGIYIIDTAYNVGSPITWDDTKATLIIQSAADHFKGVYVDLTALETAHPTANDGDYAYVDAGIGSSPDIYIWDSDDAEWVQGGSAPVSLASETVAGIVEEATDMEIASATDTGATGARLFVVPSKLFTFIQLCFANLGWSDTAKGTVERSTAGAGSESENIATQAAAGGSTGLDAARAPSEVGLKDMLIKLFNTAITWVAQQIFTAAPKFSSTTASQFLKVDSNKDLTSVASASQSDAITGTDDTKPITSLSLEKKRSVKLTTVSNSATGTIDLDCDSKQEVTLVLTTTVTGAITLNPTNASNLEILHVVIPITGTNIAITTPSTTRMARYAEVSAGDGWYQSTKILQVSSVGTADLHELSFKKGSTGPVYLLRYDGPHRA